LKPQLVLQFPDLGAQGRLADMAALGGAPELAFGGKTDRVFEFARSSRFV